MESQSFFFLIDYSFTTKSKVGLVTWCSSNVGGAGVVVEEAGSEEKEE